jgi:integrase/recombinase XerC
MGDELETRAAYLLRKDVAYLDPQAAVYEAMLQGFTNQMKSRRLNPRTIDARLRHLAALRASAEYRYPWQLTSSMFEDFMASLVDKQLKLGTLRAYQGDINAFISYARDPQNEWQRELQNRFGSECAPICHEGNMILHASDYEGSPGKRALTYDELETFFACADARVRKSLNSGRKGALSALRNSVMMKVAYGWGPRRYALTMFDISDFSTNPHAPRFGQYGVLNIRYGKAVRGGQPRQYYVFSIIELEWVVEALKQYVEEIRPHYKDSARKSALFLTERGSRIGKEELDKIFADIRDEAGLSTELTLHCMRHSFSTHQSKWKYDRPFVQNQLGHEHPSTTSLYEHVSSDFKQLQIRRSIRRSLKRQETHAAAQALKRHVANQAIE